MLAEATLARIAGGVVTAILKNPGVQRAALKRIGRDPLTRAVRRALGTAHDSLTATYPQWTAALFDESFLRKEGAPCLAAVVTRGQRADPTELARRYVASLGPAADPALVGEVEPVAAFLLAGFTTAIRAEPALAGVLDSRALDAAAEDLAAIRATLGARQATDADLLAYLRWIARRNQYLDMRGVLQTQRQVQVRLDRVYLSLDAIRIYQPGMPEPDGSAVGAGGADGAGTVAAGPEPDHPVSVRQFELTTTTLADAVAANSLLVVLGDPGSGKSTLLRHLALVNAERLRATGLAAIGASARVPILIRVAEFASSGAWRHGSLTDYLGTYHQAAECGVSAVADLLGRELAAGHCLVLLDGLDEIAQTDERIAVVRRIEEFAARHAETGNAVVVTSRVAGYEAAALGGDFAHVRTREMTREQVAAFLRRWCRAVEDAETPDLPAAARQATADREVSGILSAVDGSPGVARLATNPLLACILALIHRTGARLPQRRVELYKLVADTLTTTWRLAQGVPSSALARPEYVTRLLGTLALWMHEHRPDGLATEADVLSVLGAQWTRITGRSRDSGTVPLHVEAEVRAFLHRVRVQTGLFVERSPGRYGFLHLTFEEYFAARAMVADPDTRMRLIRERLHDPRWTEPILLALGFVGMDFPEQAQKLVEIAVLARGDRAKDQGFTPSPLEQWLGRDFRFALRCLADEIPVDPNLADELIAQATTELCTGTRRGAFESYRQALASLLTALLRTTYADRLVADILGHEGESAGERMNWSHAVAMVDSLPRHPDVRARLVALIQDPEPGVRINATAALSNAIDQPGMRTRLLELTKETEPGVRINATAALSNAIDQPGVRARLLELTRDSEPDVRTNAAVALRNAADRRDVRDRLRELTRDHDTDIGFVTAFAFDTTVPRPGGLHRLRHTAGEIGTLIHRWAAHVLDTSGRQPDPSLAERAPDGLGRLVDRLRDDDWKTQLGAAQRLIDLGQFSAEQRVRVRDALTAMLGDPEFVVPDAVRWTAAHYAYDALWALEVGTDGHAGRVGP